MMMGWDFDGEWLAMGNPWERYPLVICNIAIENGQL